MFQTSNDNHELDDKTNQNVDNLCHILRYICGCVCVFASLYENEMKWAAERNVCRADCSL